MTARLSAAELQAATASLRELDRDTNGELTADEMEPPRADAGASPDQLVTQMMSLDKNGDGALTPEEVPERMRALFSRADTNGEWPADGRGDPARGGAHEQPEWAAGRGREGRRDDAAGPGAHCAGCRSRWRRLSE